jgi:hypothetical protein
MEEAPQLSVEGVYTPGVMTGSEGSLYSLPFPTACFTVGLRTLGTRLHDNRSTVTQ